jgi:hypothetical protein
MIDGMDSWFGGAGDRGVAVRDRWTAGVGLRICDDLQDCDAAQCQDSVPKISCSAKKTSFVDIVPHVSCYVNLRFRICVAEMCR